MKFDVPKNPDLTYGGGESKVASVRMPNKMLERLKKDAKSKNRSSTEIIIMVLDQYLQSQDK